MSQKQLILRIVNAPTNDPAFSTQMLIEAMRSWLPMLESALELENTPQALDFLNRQFVKQVFSAVFVEEIS